MPNARRSRSWLPTPFVKVAAGVSAAAIGSAIVQPATWPIAAAGFAACHLALAAAGSWPRGRLLGPNLQRLPPEAHRGKVVCLTFDDGPDPEVTPRVLERLSRAGASASFFLIGERAERHPGLVAEIASQGHSIENHTYTHAWSFALSGPRRMEREIDRAQAALAHLTGRAPRYFRPPAGIRSVFLEPLLARRELALATWTRRGFDTVERDARRVGQRLVRGLAPGDLLLLHDGNSARTAAGAPVVLEALDRLLDALAAAGLAAVALKEGA